MDIKSSLKGQYHAALAMLRDTIEKCPDDIWLGGEHPRNPWRIAFHTLFYTHLYLMTEEAAFEAWAKNRVSIRILWDDDEEKAPIEPPYTQGDVLEYLAHVDTNVDAWVDLLDLDSSESGFSWYSINKLDHQLLNLRHIAGHTGQLSELLFRAGIDTDWISKR